MKKTFSCTIKLFFQISFILLIVFTTLIPSYMSFATNIPSFTYTDKDTGLTFSVPDSWEQRELSKEREILDVIFASTKEKGLTISYGSIDLWQEFSFFEKLKFSRAESNLNHLILSGDFTKSDIAKESGVAEDKVDIVTYNGKLYGKVEMISSAEINGLTLSQTVTQLYNIVNGWGYYFVFSGTSDSEYYNDFEKLVNSVEYPISKTDKSALAESKVIITLSFVGVLMCILFVIICRKISKKKDEYSTKQREWLTCENCGEILPGSSKFCYKCGSKLNEKL